MIFGFNEEELVSRSFFPSVKILVVPVTTIVLILIVIFLLISNSYSSITSTNREISESRQEESVLSQKLSILKEIEFSIEDKTSIATSALPEENSALILLALLKNISKEENVLISSTEVDSPILVGENISKTNIEIKILGEDLQSVSRYVVGISKVVPISTLEEVTLEIDQSSGQIGATVKLSPYWASFPVVISGLTEPIRNLTTEEIVLLTNLEELRKIETIEIKPTDPIEGRDPFGNTNVITEGANVPVTPVILEEDQPDISEDTENLQ